ncbi:hypothetical protein GCM10010151_11320 [Actinoallomurus spadix]|uniref:Uncharacterized protein n=1 Tax=Actinoallomurus spadix TaxID=79912 RepID=A0ABN0W251_9ACTN
MCEVIVAPTRTGYPRVIRAYRRPDGMAHHRARGLARNAPYVFTHLMDRDASPGQVVEWAVRVVSAQDDRLRRPFIDLPGRPAEARRRLLAGGRR